MLELPTGVTADYLRARVIWDPVREQPEFQALLGG
jgi:hypothetical protein